MRNLQSRFQTLLLLCLATFALHAQNEQITLLTIGKPAPPLRVRAWLKGTPVMQFEKGRVYVVEFWSTWCKPCISAMPHLSDLAHEYKDRVTMIGIDIYERKARPVTSIQKVKAFVDSLGSRMDINVAVEDTSFTVADWLDASGEPGIPVSFVVNTEGKLAWIGYPKDLDVVLSKLANNTWNISNALAERNERRRLVELDKTANDTLYPYMVVPAKQDSAIVVINEIIKNEPKLKYAPFMAFNTFSTLLRTDPHKAYSYGKQVLATNFNGEPSYDAIISAIRVHSKTVNLPAEIYQIGAEAYQLLIDYIPYPEIADTHKYYNNMADWYWRANRKEKAVNAMQKAIETLKSKKEFSRTDLAAFELRLQRYKRS